MSSAPDLIILYSLGAAMVAQFVALIVWCVALIRVGRPFLFLFVLTSLLVLIFTSFNGIMTYDPHIAMRLFRSRDQFLLFYHMFVCAEAAQIFLFVLAQIFLVRWMIKMKRAGTKKGAGVVIDRLI